MLAHTPETKFLKWFALGVAGFYLYRLFKNQGLNGEFDVDSFVEEGAKVIPHPLAKNDKVKEVIKHYGKKAFASSRLR